ncbi:MAG: hypothetical protein GXO36_02610 [Chloroflexi bacterium]|nr:hypothetical protein [Chloroflexota bacterium]
MKKWILLFGISVLVVVFFVIVLVLIGASVWAGVAVLLGLLFGWGLWSWIRGRTRWAPWLTLVSGAAISAILVWGSFARYGLLVKVPQPAPVRPHTLAQPIAFYVANITIEDPSAGTGRVEHLGYTSPEGQGTARVLGTETFQARARGWWVREVVLSTPSLPTGCVPGRVTVQGLPRGAFWAALGAEDIQRQPYLEEEVVTWRIACAQAGITFAYLRPPWHHFRAVLAPFISFAAFRERLLTFLAWLISAVLAPVLAEMLQAWLKARLEPTLAAVSHE